MLRSSRTSRAVAAVLLLCPRVDSFLATTAAQRKRAPLSLEASRGEYGDGISTDEARRSLFRSLFASAALLLHQPSPAVAAYGDAPKSEGFNYIEFLIEKNKSVNPDDLLYKGLDAEVQLKRISEAAKRLEEIPGLAQEKKWSQVQGILTGPLGTLLQTMNQLSKGSDEANKASVKVKNDIFSISDAASKKNEAAVVKATADASRDLEAFAKIVF